MAQSLPTKHKDMIGIIVGQSLMIAFLEDSAFSTGIKLASVGMTILTSFYMKAFSQNLSPQEEQEYLDKWRKKSLILGTISSGISWATLGPVFAVYGAVLGVEGAPLIDKVHQSIFYRPEDFSF